MNPETWFSMSDEVTSVMVANTRLSRDSTQIVEGVRRKENTNAMELSTTDIDAASSAPMQEPGWVVMVDRRNEYDPIPTVA